MFNCRFCQSPLEHCFLDLKGTPLSNAYLSEKELTQPELHYPLKTMVCHRCLLVQLPAHATPDHIFSDYAYFSSYSSSWLTHAQAYVEQHLAEVPEDGLVVELASNDGYLLQYFQQAHRQVLGVEPAENVAKVAQEKGIPTRVAFFGEQEAQKMTQEGIQADLIVANNVLAHVPDLNSFVKGISTLLKPTGFATIECPHVYQLMLNNQFDTIYHEHFSYFSLHNLEVVFKAHGLCLFRADELSTHGGSLRIYVSPQDKSPDPSIERVKNKETQMGLHELSGYLKFQDKIDHLKCDILSFLITARAQGKTVVGYGAPAKGNTLLNHCGIGPEFMPWVVDKSPHKQGRFLPGSHLPIYAPDHILKFKPDFVVIMPWNLSDEIAAEWACISEWGGKFVRFIPEVSIL